VPGFLATGPFRLKPRFLQVGKYSLDDHPVLNAGDHFDGAACTAPFDVDIEKKKFDFKSKK
jgi:hypothetical protein